MFRRNFLKGFVGIAAMVAGYKAVSPVRGEINLSKYLRPRSAPWFHLSNDKIIYHDEWLAEFERGFSSIRSSISSREFT